MKTKGTRVNKGVPNIKPRRPKETIHNATFEPDNGSGGDYSNLILAIGIIAFGIMVWAICCN